MGESFEKTNKIGTRYVAMLYLLVAIGLDTSPVAAHRTMMFFEVICVSHIKY